MHTSIHLQTRSYVSHRGMELQSGESHVYVFTAIVSRVSQQRVLRCKTTPIVRSIPPRVEKLWKLWKLDVSIEIYSW